MIATYSLVQYIVLNLLLLLVFFLVGKNISKGGNYWKSAVWAILFFTFISGSRFARGNDYMHYIDVYQWDLEAEQYVFTWFNHVLKALSVQGYFIFYFYAFVFVSCMMIFLQPFKKYANVVFPLALMATLSFEEFQIRQAFGFSMVFLFTYELMFAQHKKKTKILLCILYFVLCIGIHSGNVFILLLIIFFYLLFRRPIPLVFSIPAYIIASYIISNLGDLGFLQPIMDFLNSGDSDSKISQYAGNADRWFGADAYEDIYTRNPIVKVFETLGNIALLYFGYKDIVKTKANAWLKTFYNMFVVGTLIQKGFMNLEILNRMGGDTMIFWFIPLAHIINDRKLILKKTNFFEKIFLIFLLWWIYGYAKYIFFPKEMTLFLWDLIN